jgi:Ca2+-binding EF-hand superfamily protein
MEFNIMHSLNQFHSLYEDHLKEPSCLAICMEDLCSGWNTETFKQILSKMTLKSSTCVPLFYLKHEELRIFSNKNNTLQEVFKLFDTRGLSRIDGMELVCSMAMISSGPLISKIEACFYAFSVNEENKFDRNQFCFFMDCLCRGLYCNYYYY